MDKQFLMNKEINVQYAYKKDGKGERHGDQAERLLASQARKHNVSIPTPQLPPQLFAPQGPAAGITPASVPAAGQVAFRGGQPPRAPASFPDQQSGGFQGGPPMAPRGAPPQMPQGFHPQQKLAPPPQGLPPRPPPLASFQPQGYAQMPVMPVAPPPGFGPPATFASRGAPGAPTPGFASPGFAVPPPPPVGFRR